MSTFIPRGFTPFQEALARLGPSCADELHQALYAGTVRACLMDGREIQLPPHWWACDRSWNQAVATGRGSVSTGALYFETVSRGPILVRSDDVDRLLAALQGSQNSAAPSHDAASPSEPCPPRDSAMDPFEATSWNQAQVVLWICSRDRAAVRQTSDWSFRAVDDAIMIGIREGVKRGADFFLMSFGSAEQEAISKLSGGELRAFGRKNGRGIRESIPAEEWPGLCFYHNGREAPLWPDRSLPHIGCRDIVTSIRDPNEAANPPFWTDVIFEREAVLKIWRFWSMTRIILLLAPRRRRHRVHRSTLPTVPKHRRAILLARVMPLRFHPPPSEVPNPDTIGLSSATLSIV